MSEQTVFLAAVDIADLAERAAYLNRACAGNVALRRQVEALLAAHERSGEFLDVPALRQLAHGVAEARHSPDETRTEYRDPQGDVDLSFLQPSTKPGSLGRLGHYEVQEVIGRGGCGIVLKAFDEMLHRMVAIKVMAPELAATSPARKRFLREARAAAAIRHENVVNIHAVEDQPIPFLVMEYIAGPTLQQKLDGTGPLDVIEVVRIGHQIAGGLAAAHSMGLIHRDIKPGNVLLEGGRDRIKITDFGLARSADDASLTQSGVIAGTPLYMSPEQAQGLELDHRSDLFSLGSVLYVMCSGRPPFRAATTLAVLKRVAEDQPRPIREVIPEVPKWLIAIITKLLAKDPADRFASAQELADLLGHCLSELQRNGRVELPADVLPTVPKAADAATEPIKSESPKTQEKPARGDRPPRRRRWVAAAAVLVALLTGLGMTEATGVTNVRGTVIRLFSPDGTLVVEVDDPGVSVSIDGEEMVITGTGAKEIRLKPGQYRVLASKDGKPMMQELVTVTKNGRQVVRVSREAGSPAKASTVNPAHPAASVDDAWLQSVAALPTVKQVEAVVKKLRERNPDFDGAIKHVVEGGVVTELQFSSAGVTDLSPVRALRGLKRLNLRCGDPMGKLSELVDLSPLSGMRLVDLNCDHTSVIDLTPLQNVPLEGLSCCATPLVDLSPLKGMPLKRLFLHASPVTDLSPIKGMQLEALSCDRTRVIDLAPIKGMPLQAIFCDFNPKRHAEILRSIKTLTWINHRSAAEFWKEVDQTAEEAWLQSVADLSTAKQVEAVAKKLRELNPDFDGKLTHQVEGGVVTQAELSAVGVTDLSPLRAFRGLKRLYCTGLFQKGAVLADLSPLSDLKLVQLHCQSTSVTDLTPLKHMPLEDLNCHATRIVDLSPLKGLPLKRLVCGSGGVTDLTPLKGMALQAFDCGYSGLTDLTPLAGMPLKEVRLFRSRVSDLSPLKGMKLEILEIADTPVTDLSAIKDMPLRELMCPFKPERDRELLQSIKTLERINYKPAAEFWKEVDQKK